MSAEKLDVELCGAARRIWLDVIQPAVCVRPAGHADMHFDPRYPFAPTWRDAGVSGDPENAQRLEAEELVAVSYDEFYNGQRAPLPDGVSGE